MKVQAPLQNRECYHPNSEAHCFHNKTTNGQVPVETIVWLRPEATLYHCIESEPDVDPHSPGLIEEVHQNGYREINDCQIITNHGHCNQHRHDADWVFRLRSSPPRQFSLNDLVKAAAPSICSVIIARLWIVLGVCNISTAVTLVSFILISNVGVLILFGISWICECYWIRE